LKAIFGEEEDHPKMRGRILALAFEFTGTLRRVGLGGLFRSTMWYK
jgi:hypothetical protein